MRSEEVYSESQEIQQWGSAWIWGTGGSLFGMQAGIMLCRHVWGAEQLVRAQGEFYSFGGDRGSPEVSEPWHLRRHQLWWPGTGSAEAKKGHMSQEMGCRAKALQGEVAAWCQGQRTERAQSSLWLMFLGRNPTATSETQRDSHLPSCHLKSVLEARQIKQGALCDLGAQPRISPPCHSCHSLSPE